MNPILVEGREDVFQAVQYDKTNGLEVAKWCKGQLIQTLEPGSDKVIRESVAVPKAPAQAVPSDWILRNAEGGFAFISDNEFQEEFVIHDES